MKQIVSICFRQVCNNVSVQYSPLSPAREPSIQMSPAEHVFCVCVRAACGIWCLGLSGCGESYESSLCNWNVMRTGEEFDWTGAFSHAPMSPRQMSNSFPNEKWHSPNLFLLLRPPPPSSVTPSRRLHSAALCDSSLPICSLTVINDGAW